MLHLSLEDFKNTITKAKALSLLNIEPTYTLDVSLSDGEMQSDYKLRVNYEIKEVLLEGEKLLKEQSNSTFMWDWKK